jgi:hypothetical protein
MINPKQLRDLIIIPALDEIDKGSDAAVNLLLGTCAQESAMGAYLSQYPSGPAKGIFQMEDATHDDIWHNYIGFRSQLYKDLQGAFDDDFFEPETMIFNLRYAAVMCRIHYLRVPKALPDKDDIIGLAEYWKEFYNTHLGAGEVSEFMDNYQRYVLDVAL